MTEEQLELIEADARAYIAQEETKSDYSAPYHHDVIDMVSEVRKLRVALSNLAELYDSDEGCRSLPQYIEARKLLAAPTSAA
jgi:hypothetical protein